MITTEGFLDGPNGSKVFTCTWKPEGDVKATLVLVHGLGEHCSRYGHVAEYFTAAGYAIFAFDWVGHGKSSGRRGATSFDEASAIIDILLKKAADEHPHAAHFLYGHSMGGAEVIYYGFTRKPAVAGIVATSPGLQTTQPISPVKKFMARAMGTIQPSFTLANGLEQAALSRVATVVSTYAADPLVHDKISARLGLDIMDKGEWMLQQKDFPLPMLVVHGTGDRIVSCSATRRLAENNPENVTFRAYDGFYHEMHNEAEQREVLSYILGWLDAQIATTQPA